ncbi:unnamed protein product [Arctia plantaginis]|uniref:Uncharacterized protein n=1 Tax=Arctia plantaginis TaxID=874455 RepID=A0A8S0Z6Q5_ARCPL|nr:unnamed protein product [Arctia plantaginis]
MKSEQFTLQNMSGIRTIDPYFYTYEYYGQSSEIKEEGKNSARCLLDLGMFGCAMSSIQSVKCKSGALLKEESEKIERKLGVLRY